MRDKLNHGANLPTVWSARLVTKFLSNFPTISRKIHHLGEYADFQLWLSETFSPPPSRLHRREELWSLILSHLEGESDVRFWEFGVAHGYLTEWWISRIASPSARWDGFDRFTGLPRAWRNLPKGAFDADGNPPTHIVDDRVRWHVGNVEETLPMTSLVRSTNERWVIFFDLDIYEPSSFVWQTLKTHTRSGDILYFDEALDVDERHLINHEVLPYGNFLPIGSTPWQLALKIS